MPDLDYDELRKEIEKILKSADLSKVSTKKVIQQLEDIFDTELEPKDRQAVDKMVMEFVNSMESEEEEEEQEEEEEEDDEPKKKKPKKRAAAAKSKKAPAKTGGRGKGGGYTRAHRLSPALAALMGAEQLAHHEVVKRTWALIKERQLYDPSDKRFAICDEALHKVIGIKRFRIFGMMKYLKVHFLED